MPSQELADILALVPPDFADATADYAAVRAMLAPFHGHAVPAHVSVDKSSLGGVRVGWYRSDAEGGDTIDAIDTIGIAFHCHGGGFVACPLDDYDFYGAMLVDQLGLSVVMPDYRLAPEHPFPAAHEDCLDAYRGLMESGVDPAQVVVMGDSCGGGLALSTLVAAHAEGLPMPACYVSISGWFDLSVEVPDVEAPDPFLSAPWVRNRGRDYSAGRVPL